MTNTQDLQNKLKKLIANSPALQSLPEEALRIRMEVMLSADDKTLQQFINVLEEEAAEIQKIDEGLQKDATIIQNLVNEAKGLKREAKREIRNAVENEDRKHEEDAALDLLKKLDDIHEESKK